MLYDFSFLPAQLCVRFENNILYRTFSGFIAASRWSVRFSDKSHRISISTPVEKPALPLLFPEAELRPPGEEALSSAEGMHTAMLGDRRETLPLSLTVT